MRNLIEKRFSQDRLYLDGLGRLGRCIFSWTLGLGFASLHDSQQVSVRLFLFLFFFPSHGHNCQSLPLLLPPFILPPLLLPHGHSFCSPLPSFSSTHYLFAEHSLSSLSYVPKCRHLFCANYFNCKIRLSINVD